MNLPCGHGLSAVEQWFLAQLLAPTLQREVGGGEREREKASLDKFGGWEGGAEGEDGRGTHVSLL